MDWPAEATPARAGRLPATDAGNRHSRDTLEPVTPAAWPWGRERCWRGRDRRGRGGSALTAAGGAALRPRGRRAEHAHGRGTHAVGPAGDASGEGNAEPQAAGLTKVPGARLRRRPRRGHRPNTPCCARFLTATRPRASFGSHCGLSGSSSSSMARARRSSACGDRDRVGAASRPFTRPHDGGARGALERDLRARTPEPAAGRSGARRARTPIASATRATGSASGT